MPLAIRSSRTDRKLINLPVGAVHPNPNQPRRLFDAYELQGLTQSIRQNGILQPLLVRVGAQGRYELVAGERRLRAAKAAGLHRVPCIVQNMDEMSSAVFSILENLQRRDLSMFEEAEGICKLMQHYGMSQTDAAERLGIAQSTLANKLRILKLSDEQKQRIMVSGLSERHARALLRLPEALRDNALDQIIAKALNVSETDRFVSELLLPKPMAAPPKRTAVVTDMRLFVNSLSRIVDTMRRSGVDAKTVKNDTGEFIEYTVKIPKTAVLTGRVGI